MGAWGLGPFDSDAGLDFLGDLADQTCTRTEDGDIVPGSVDHAKVETLLRQRLQTPPGEWEGGELYAAIGLVTAGLHPMLSTSERGGTRLLAKLGGEATADLALDVHAGYGDLISAEAGALLREAAVAAVAHLRADRAWVDGWFGDMAANLDQLDWLLARPDQITDDQPA